MTTPTHRNVVGTRTSRRRQLWYALIALTGVGLMGVLAACIRMPAAPKETQVAKTQVAADPNVLRYSEGAPQLTAIRVNSISASALSLTDNLSGRIVYDEDKTARIGVAVAGRVVVIKVAPGDSVKAGQILAEIDSPDLATASADLTKAHADEKHKRLALERAKDLVPGEAIAVKDFESLQADLAQASAETARAEQRLKNLNPRGVATSGQRLRLTSPIDGIVTERTATPALEVNSALTAPLFVVTDPRHLWLMIDVPEQLLGKVVPGGAVEVESDAYPGDRFSATIAQRGLLVDPNTRRVTVRARLDNPKLKLLPEMFVRTRLLQRGGAGVRVPNSALVNQGVNTYVFIQTAPAAFTRRKVNLLTQGGEESYIGDGLKGGERVVVAGALLLDAEREARASAQP